MHYHNITMTQFNYENIFLCSSLVCGFVTDVALGFWPPMHSRATTEGE